MVYFNHAEQPGTADENCRRKGKSKVNLETANNFLKLMRTLRGNRPFIPKESGGSKPSRKPAHGRSE